MSNFLMFVMVAAIFVHTFLNFFLSVYTSVVSKLSGVVVAEHSVEAFVSNVVSGVVGFFKKL